MGEVRLTELELETFWVTDLVTAGVRSSGMLAGQLHRQPLYKDCSTIIGQKTIMGLIILIKITVFPLTGGQREH